MSSRPSSERVAKFAPLFLTVVGFVGGGYIGCLVAANQAAVDIAQYQAQNNGDDGGASEGWYALYTGLPVGAFIGALSGLILGSLIAKLLNKKNARYSFE